MILCCKISHMIEGNADRHLVNMVLDDDGQTLGQLGDVGVVKKAEAKLNDLIEARFAEKGGPYADAFRAVMGAPKNKALVQCYAGLTADRHAQDAELEMSSQEAGLEIASLARSYMADHQTDYETAYRAVLGANSALKTAYGQA